MAAIGSTPGEAPPQIMEIEAVGAIAVLLENLSLNPYSAASGHAPLSSANSFDAFIYLLINLFKYFFIPRFSHYRLKWNSMFL